MAHWLPFGLEYWDEWVGPLCCERSLCFTTLCLHSHDDSISNGPLAIIEELAKAPNTFEQVKLLQVCNVLIGMW